MKNYTAWVPKIFEIVVVVTVKIRSQNWDHEKIRKSSCRHIFLGAHCIGRQTNVD